MFNVLTLGLYFKAINTAERHHTANVSFQFNGVYIKKLENSDLEIVCKLQLTKSKVEKEDLPNESDFDIYNIKFLAMFYETRFKKKVVQVDIFSRFCWNLQCKVFYCRLSDDFRGSPWYYTPSHIIIKTVGLTEFAHTPLERFIHGDLCMRLCVGVPLKKDKIYTSCFFDSRTNPYSSDTDNIIETENIKHCDLVFTFLTRLSDVIKMIEKIEIKIQRIAVCLPLVSPMISDMCLEIEREKVLAIKQNLVRIEKEIRLSRNGEYLKQENLEKLEEQFFLVPNEIKIINLLLDQNYPFSVDDDVYFILKSPYYSIKNVFNSDQNYLKQESNISSIGEEIKSDEHDIIQFKNTHGVYTACLQRVEELSINETPSPSTVNLHEKSKKKT
ncbi:hypothetical protein CDIK_0036 [Cucumispora dikerogammari]|nr:hypothetical protein CDIK_0036 [Cucumispora dikerogammari]